MKQAWQGRIFGADKHVELWLWTAFIWSAKIGIVNEFWKWVRQGRHIRPRMSTTVLNFVIVGHEDHPIYEADLTAREGVVKEERAQYLHQVEF